MGIEHDPSDVEQSKALSEYFKCKTQQANYEQIIQQLVPIDHITSYLMRAAGILRIGLGQLPDRLAPRLSKESDEETCHSLISKEIQDISKSFEHIIDEESFKSYLDSNCK